MVTDPRVRSAIEVYNTEYRAWSREPVRSSEYNDRGRIRYRTYMFHDLNRGLSIVAALKPTPNTQSFQRHYVNEEAAESFIQFRAMQAVLESLT